MKAVLVIDEMPIICLSCPFVLSHICEGSKQTIGEIMTDTKVRHESCPLKPLPQMREPNEEWLNEYHIDEFADGWNACLKEIEK